MRLVEALAVGHPRDRHARRRRCRDRQQRRRTATRPSPATPARSRPRSDAFFADDELRAAAREPRRRRPSSDVRARAGLRAARGDPAATRRTAEAARALRRARTRYRLPLDASARRASSTRCARRLDVRVLGSAPAGGADRRRHVPARAAGSAAPRSTAPLFYADAAVPGRARAAALPARRGDRPEPRSRQLAALLARTHRARPGESRSSTSTATGGRRHGCTARRTAGCSAPLGDRVVRVRAAGAPMRSGRSPATRPGSSREAGVEPAGGLPRLHGPRSLPASVRRSRCPSGRSALFVGVLEAYKNVDGLADAWRRVGAAGCRTRGFGSSARARARTSSSASSPSCPGRRRGTRELPTPAVAARAGRRELPRAAVALRRARPGRDRGALPRPRPVVGSRVGGIPDLDRGRASTACSSSPDDTEALADALAAPAHRPRAAGATCRRGAAKRRARGSRRLRSTRPGCGRSSSTREATRLHHAAGRPGPSRPRRDGADDRGARRGASTRSSFSPTAAAPGTLPGELPGRDLRRAGTSSARPPLRGGARHAS